jgi:hypothetical protein
VLAPRNVAAMSAHPAAPGLAGLQAVLATARGLVDDLLHDPLLPRVLAAFSSLPENERETILAVLERDATWRRIIDETSGPTGIRVRPNPHASLYVHVTEEPEPSARDIDVIRLGIARFLPLLPLFFQPGVHEQWTRSARELIRDASPEVREMGARLAREVLALIAEADAAK